MRAGRLVRVDDQRYRRLAGVVVAYLVLFAPLRALGAGLAGIAALPVAVIGGTFGLRAGVIAGALAFPANTLLLNLSGDAVGWGAALADGGSISSLAVLAIGAGAGWLRETTQRSEAATRALANERSLLKQEISARRRAEGALRASEARLRGVVTNLPVGVVAFDAEGTVVLAEGKLLGALGLPDHIVGRSAAELSDVHPAAAGNVEQALEGHEFTTFEQLGGHNLETRYAPLRDQAGEVVGVLSLSLDLEEREQTQRALRESEQRFRRLFEESPIGIGLAGVDLSILRVNRALCDMLGYAESELVGRPFTEITHRDDIELDVSLVRQLFAGEIPSYRIEKRLLRKDGQAVWVGLTATVVRDDRGTPLHSVAMVENVTERRRSQETLEHLALYDALTDLPNRTLLHERLSQELRAARRTGSSLALMVLDLDRFKRANDAHGHHVADECLRQIGPRFREALREADTVARLGGDEFILLLPMTDEKGAREVARKVLAALARPFQIEGRSLVLGASIGIAIHPRDGEEADQLLRHADIAMYVAKATGEGSAVYSPRVFD